MPAKASTSTTRPPTDGAANVVAGPTTLPMYGVDTPVMTLTLPMLERRAVLPRTEEAEELLCIPTAEAASCEEPTTLLERDGVRLLRTDVASASWPPLVE